jgi:D-alanine-D-alanine ligase
MSNVGTGKVVVGIIYGGRNNEHEVSLRSAASVFKRLDRTRFDARTIYIDKAGVFHWAAIPETFTQSNDSALPMLTDAPEVVFLPRPKRDANGKSKAQFLHVNGPSAGKIEECDVLMPMVHGNNAEDGTLQGLFECANVAYTGSNVLGSAIGMDKEVSKRLAQVAGLPIVPYRVAHVWNTPDQLEAMLIDVERQFHFPVFVKPAREGSSVGVFKVKTREDFMPRLQEAFTYDSKVLIEKAISAREIEFSVLQNLDRSKPPHVSIPAEIVPTHEFYSYDAKYNDANGAVIKLPAEISDELKSKMTALVQKTFNTLELEGYARVDLFLDKETGAYYLNEVNTLPGFTSISMFPKMFEATHIPYVELITRLIELALKRNQLKKV